MSQPKTYKILIVDDMPENIYILKEALRGEYRIVAALSGAKALQLAYSDKPPDLILLDIMMPEMDGYEVLKCLRKDARTRDLPVIFITAKDQDADEAEGLRLGAVDYIAKPFSPSIVRARVATHLKLKNFHDELRKKDVQLIEMDRIAGIGTLAAGIAHEINTPLGFMKSSITSLQKDCLQLTAMLLAWKDKPADGFQKEAFCSALEKMQFATVCDRLDGKFQRVFRGSERIQKIVDSLRSFSRVDRNDFCPLNVNQSVEEVIELLTSEGRHIDFIKDLGPLPEIECIASEINQCLLHVTKNAVDAIGEKGKVIFRTRHDPHRNCIEVAITDNGPGMSEEIRHQLFNPFFTTKPVGSGTGLGLTITEQIVKKHNGQVIIDSAEGQGTMVILRIPVKEIA